MIGRQRRDAHFHKRRENQQFIARGHRAANNLPGISAVVFSADHILDGHAQWLPIHVLVHRHGLQVLEDAESVEPTHTLAAAYDVVAVEGDDRHEININTRDLVLQGFKLLPDAFEHILPHTDQIHFVDGYDDVPDSEK